VDPNPDPNSHQNVMGPEHWQNLDADFFTETYKHNIQRMSARLASFSRG
jgi:hypothetical protein